MKRALAGYRHWRRGVRRSIPIRIGLVFLMLALATSTLLTVSAHWFFGSLVETIAEPLMGDYVQRLGAQLTADDTLAPQVTAAAQLVDRLPLTVVIRGPQVNWASANIHDWSAVGLWHYYSADGHRISFDLDRTVVLAYVPILFLITVGILLLTAGAFWYVHRTLYALQTIQRAAERFGAGQYSEPIERPVIDRSDELGQLARTLNRVGKTTAQLLASKRTLLLAISHELRSPLTRARLNTELLPEDGECASPRQALLNDLQQMATLIDDLLESERLNSTHGALQRIPCDLLGLVQTLVQEIETGLTPPPQFRITHSPGLPDILLDPIRIRLLVRNLILNAIRYGADPRTQQIRIDISLAGIKHARSGQWQGVFIRVRDYGAGVAPDALPHLAQAFYRPDDARRRDGSGGVGLGLYLCRLITQAHQGRFSVENAHPGLRAQVFLPALPTQVGEPHTITQH